MDLIDRVQEKIVKIKKNGDVPGIIWMGIEERRDLQSYIREGNPKIVSREIESGKMEFLGLPVEFVSSPEWLSITTTNKI